MVTRLCALGIGAVVIGGLVGCGPKCRTEEYYGGPDTGWGWYGWTWMEVGIGTRDFIEVPWGLQVSPDHTGGEPYYNVALRGSGMERSGVTVDLAAWVGETRYAEAHFDGVELQCRARNQLEVGSLRLPLDPSTLPLMTPAPVPVSPEVPDTGFDTGWWRYVDTGYYEPGPVLTWEPDVRVEAVLREPSGRETRAESLWFVYR